MPVFPAVPSTSVPPARRAPRRSASSTIPLAARSFTEPPGLRNSAFPTIVRPMAAESLGSTICGVPPMAPPKPARVITTAPLNRHEARPHVRSACRRCRRYPPRPGPSSPRKMLCTRRTSAPVDPRCSSDPAFRRLPSVTLLKLFAESDGRTYALRDFVRQLKRSAPLRRCECGARPWRRRSRKSTERK